MAELTSSEVEGLITLVGSKPVHTVVAQDIIGRLMIQCALQPGLAAVWELIMGFDGVLPPTS